MARKRYEIKSPKRAPQRAKAKLLPLAKGEIKSRGSGLKIRIWPKIPNMILIKLIEPCFSVAAKAKQMKKIIPMSPQVKVTFLPSVSKAIPKKIAKIVATIS
jgi:hypothetical protein